MRTFLKSASMNSFNSDAVKPTAKRAAVIAPTLDPATRLIFEQIPASSSTCGWIKKKEKKTSYIGTIFFSQATFFLYLPLLCSVFCSVFFYRNHLCFAAVVIRLLARLSKPKSTTHDVAQAIRKKILKQKTSYTNS